MPDCRTAADVALSACSMRIRGVVTPFRGSVSGSPVERSAPRIVATDAEADCCFKIAKAPETCGVASEVPLPIAVPPPGYAETIASPGARSERNEAESEKLEI